MAMRRQKVLVEITLETEYDLGLPANQRDIERLVQGYELDGDTDLSRDAFLWVEVKEVR